MLGVRIIDEVAPPRVSAEPRSIAEVLGDAAIEPGATGALLFGPPARPVGTVFLEEGRVCWAATAGMNRRLTDLLARASGTEAARIEQVYLRCRRDGTPLGEALVEAGVVSAPALRQALRRHTAEALLVMATSGARAAGRIRRRERRYDAAFTFSPAEILAAAGEILHPEEAAIAAEELGDVVPAGAFGASFAQAPRGGDPELIGLAGELDLGLAEILALGRWSARALDHAGRSGSGAPLACASVADRAAVVVWARGAARYASICRDRAEVAWVFAKLERGRAPVSRSSVDGGLR